MKESENELNKRLTFADVANLFRGEGLDGIPHIHCHKSNWWGAWFAKTPPPSPDQVALQLLIS